MDSFFSSISLGFRKSSNSYEVNALGKQLEATLPELSLSGLRVARPELNRASSLSTNYPSSPSSSISSSFAEDLSRRFSDSSAESPKLSRSKMKANNNDAFVMDDDELCYEKEAQVQVQEPVKKSSKEAVKIKEEIELKPRISDSKVLDNCFVSFYINGKRCLVMVNSDYFVYEQELTSSSAAAGRVSIQLSDIVAVRTCLCQERVSRKQTPHYCPCVMSDSAANQTSASVEIDPSQKPRPFVLKLFYTVQKAKQGYRLKMLTLSTFDARWKPESAVINEIDALAAVAYKIRDHLSFFNRPKRLLLFVNPYGGSKKGIKVFEKSVKPILQVADIDFTLIVTERADHAKDMLLNEETDLTVYDGIVCVGGDGMFGEILNGILIRTQRENSVNYGSVDAVLKKPSIKLGIVPAGSTDAVVFATSNNREPVNSVIPIVLGRQVNVDVGAVHHRDEEKLIRYSASFIGYGFFGDTIQDSEQMRWLGSKRYDLAGLRKFLKHRLYSGEIKLCIEPSDGSPKEYNPCGIDCLTCKRAGSKSRQTLSADDAPACISIRGRFLAINSAILSCRCNMSKYGMSPMAHVGNGCTDLILISKCSRFAYFRYLFALAFSTKSPFDFDFVDAYRVREFEFNPIVEPQKRKGYTYEKSVDCDFFDAFDENSNEAGGESGETSYVPRHATRAKPTRNASLLTSSVWNCDGEIVSEPAVHVKVHCQLVTLYAPGCEVQSYLYPRA